MRVTIASLKFSPGHYSHVVALAKLFAELGFSPMLVLDRGYSSFAADCRFDCMLVDGADGLRSIKSDLHVIYNLSTQDSKAIDYLKKSNPKVKSILVYHEPYNGVVETVASFLRKKRSLKHIVSIFGRHVFSYSLLSRVDQVWLPSENALNNYLCIDSKRNPNGVLRPLMFADEWSDKYDEVDRPYFSYISTALPAKGFPEYLSAVKSISKLDNSMSFQIATKTDISSYIDSELTALIDEGRLVVQSGRPMSNDEINMAYRSSFCTWLGYNASTQSGVLCKAFMFGSPVLATKVGAFEEYIDGSNGLFIRSNTDCVEIRKQLDEILENIASFEASSRASYFKYFDYGKYIEEVRENLRTLNLGDDLNVFK